MAGTWEQEAAPLLLTKLFVPRLRSGLIPRSRLEGELRCLLERPLTVLSAPAGSGKTTLVAQWLSTLSGTHICWLSLDPRDNELFRFWRYVAASLEAAVPAAGATVARLVSSGGTKAIDYVLTELLNMLAAVESECVLVLDDFHVIRDEAVHDSLAYFLRHLPPGFHVIISTRTELPLPLTALRAKGEVWELPFSALRFTRSEMRAFFEAAAQITLDDELLGSLDRATEGWAAALQLTALAVRGRRPSEELLRIEAGPDNYLFDYLAEEVFAGLDEGLKGFLLSTVFLDRFSQALCEASCGVVDAPAYFDRLEALNLFLVPLDPERSWFRYHHLFSVFLRTQAERVLAPETIRGILARASLWYESQGEIGQAVEHALAAGDHERVMLLIARETPKMFARNDLLTLRSWLERIPRSGADIRILIMTAWVLIATGSPHEADPILTEVERVLGVRADGAQAIESLDSETRCLLGELCTLHASIAMPKLDIRGQLSFSKLALRCVEGVTASEGIDMSDQVRATALFNLALAEELMGETAAATARFQDAVLLSRKVQNLHLTPMILSHLGNLRFAVGDLDGAFAYYRGVLEEGRRGDGSISPLTAVARVGCGRVLLARGSLDEAASTLAEGVALGRQWANWESIFPGMICLARIRAARGETSAASALTAEVAQLGKRLRVPDAALDMITLYGALFDAGGNRPHESALTHVKALIEAERDQPLLREEELILGARLLLSGEEWTRALDLLAAIEVGTRAGGRIAPLIEVALLRARGLLGAGKGDEAKAAVAEASGLAAPSGFLFPFLEAGSAIVPLIERLEGNTPFHKRILGLFGGSEGKASPAGLSERELDVLGLLAGGLSNQQIAERLYVSANTVKSHLKSIFAKLDVESRTQAVARARELGIAP